jgi:hypothetical protein
MSTRLCNVLPRCLALFCMLASCAYGQCTYPPKEPPRRTVSAFPLTRLRADAVQALKAALLKDCFTDALVTYFGEGYSGAFPDWIIYVPSVGSIHQGLVHNGESTAELKEQSHIWVLVFTDAPLVNTGKVPDGITYLDTTDLRLARRTIVYRRDPTFTMLIKGLAKTVGLDALPEAGPSDTTRILSLHRISVDPYPALYATVGRVSIAENTEFELSISPVPLKSFDSDTDLRSAYLTVANARRHAFDLALIAGASYGPPIRTFGDDGTIKSTSTEWLPNAYLSAVANLVWIPAIWSGRRLPAFMRRPAWQQTSLGLFAGTNVLRGSIGDEFIAGGVIGNVLSSAGISIGSAWIDSPETAEGHIVHRRKARAFYGIDLRF